MLSLHALWDDAHHQIHLWLERPPRTTPPNATPNPTTRRHPGARGHIALARATAKWLGKSFATNAQHISRKLILPTLGDTPLSSPEIQLTQPTQPITWQAWRVPTLAPHNPSAALRRLAKAKLPEGATLSASTQFWVAASQLVDDLIARRAFAPYAGDAEYTLLARWSPLFDAEASAAMRAWPPPSPGA
ncbi:MAG: hypothetical protein HC853_06075, partial [Anaerolineae bacterium]|nr:hypothetical protein [Anaerolineae bacterium]